jgi:hypothetical protein
MSRPRFHEQFLDNEFAEPDLNLHRPHTHGQFPADSPSRRNLEQQSREAAAEARRRPYDEAAHLKVSFELEQRREEARAAEARHIREQEARTMELRTDSDVRVHHRRDAAVAQARPQYNLEAIVPKIKLSDISQRQYASEGSSRPEEERQRYKDDPIFKVRTEYDSSDSNADDDIEELVREWTNLYD